MTAGREAPPYRVSAIIYVTFLQAAINEIPCEGMNMKKSAFIYGFDDTALHDEFEKYDALYN